MIGWFSIDSRYSVFFVRLSGQSRVCFFVAVVLPDHCGQNTVKGRLTQASKEKWRQALRGFFGGQVTERGRKRIPLLRQARSANKHHLQGWDNAWSSGTGLNITSFLATGDFYRTAPGLATGVAERLSFGEMPQLLAPQ